MADPKSAADSIRSKFGLDYLPSTSSPSSFAELTSSKASGQVIDLVSLLFDGRLSDSLVTTVNAVVKVLNAIYDSPAHSDSIYQLVDHTALDFDTVLNIIDRLSALGLIQYIQKDRRGNHVVQLSESGRDVTAILVQALKLLNTLKNSPRREMAIYDLVDCAGIEFDTVIKIVDQLNKVGLTKYIRKDPRGNHLVQLDDKSLALLP